MAGSQVRSAEEAISKALFANRDVIKSVLSGGRLTIRNASGKAIGYGFRRGGSQRIVMKNVRVVIEFQQYNGNPNTFSQHSRIYRYKMQKFHFLDQLIFGYFNQDADIINDGEDTIEGIVRLFKKSVPDWMLNDLVEEVDDFISAYDGNVEKEFSRRYGFDFALELWETTAHEFLMTVRQISSEK